MTGPSSLKHSTAASVPHCFTTRERGREPWPKTMEEPRPRRLGRPKTPKRQPRRRRALPTPARARLLIGSCVAASCVGVEYGLIYPTIYPYLRELGAHPTVVTGVAAAAFSLAKTAAFVPLGALADRFGPRKPAVIAFLVAAMGNVYYFAASRPLDVVVARAIVGLGSSVTGVLLGVVGSGNCEDATMRRKRDLRLAVFNGTSLLAVLAGPGLAALFSVLPEGEHPVFDIDAYSAPGLFLAALALLCAASARHLLGAEMIFARGDGALPATPPAQRSVAPGRRGRHRAQCLGEAGPRRARRVDNRAGRRHADRVLRGRVTDSLPRHGLPRRGARRLPGDDDDDLAGAGMFCVAGCCCHGSGDGLRKKNDGDPGHSEESARCASCASGCRLRS